MMWAHITNDKTITGNKISGKNSAAGALAEVKTIPGSHPSQILKIRINKVADTNSGMVIAKIANVEAIKSGVRSRHNPVMTPSINANGTPILIAHSASRSEFCNRSPTIELIFVLPSTARPRSPVMAPPAHSAKRSIAGRFKSRSLRHCASSSSSA